MSNLRQLRARSNDGYHKFDTCSGSTSTTADQRSDVRAGLSPGPSDSMRGMQGRYSPWSWTEGVRSQSQSPPGSEWHRLQSHDPDRLFLSVNMTCPADTTEEEENVRVTMPPPLPHWVWKLLTFILGLGTDGRRKKLCVATILHVLTLLAAAMFGICGLYFNIYDTLSEFTRTTVLVCVAKSVLGLYWIGLGSYANSLAARLFNNKRMVDCIRLHSKTFLKISTALIVILLSMLVVATNLYSNLYLLELHHPGNTTKIKNANCVSVGLDVRLCQIYFISKIFYSCLCLMWNLMVVGIFLSICRTHTISIRRFMKELMYDTRIYEEYGRIQALEEKLQTMEESGQVAGAEKFVVISDSHIWDDDIAGFDYETHGGMEPSSNAHLLQTLTLMRQNTCERIAEDIASSLQNPAGEYMEDHVTGRRTRSEPGETVQEEKDEERENQLSDGEEDVIGDATALSGHVDERKPSSGGESGRRGENLPPLTTSRQEPPPELERQLSSKSVTLTRGPPILSVQELLFTYFKLLRRLSSTSRLLQRWISSWITFVMLWCALLIVYWTSHTAELTGIVQFLVPLVALGLLTSAYAEVNFEGERLVKCILPTEERMAVVYYFQNSKLEMKIFSFTMTYNTIVTVVAGVAVTFATRIILDQFS